MGNRLLQATFISLLSTLLFVSCDLTSDQAGLYTDNTAIHIRHSVESPHRSWDDELIILPDGNMIFNRKSGESIPPINGDMSNDELAYIQNLLRKIDPYRDVLQELAPPTENNRFHILYKLNGVERKLETSGNIPYQSLSHDLRTNYSKLLREILSHSSSLLAIHKHGVDLSFDFHAAKRVVSLDENIPLIYSVRNSTSEIYRLFFANALQLAISIYNNGEKVFHAPYGWQPSASAWDISPRNTDTRRSGWNQVTDKFENIYKVKAGDYTIVQYLDSGNSPRFATRVRITEDGETKVQPIIVRTNFRPVTFDYLLNNRVSQVHNIRLGETEQAEYIIRDSNQQVVRRDFFTITDESTLTLDGFEDFSISIPWDYLDNDGNQLEPEFYSITVQLAGDQLPAEHRFFYSRR